MTGKKKEAFGQLAERFWRAKRELEEAARTGSPEERARTEEQYRRLSRAGVPSFLEEARCGGFTSMGGLEVSLKSSIRVAFHRVDQPKALRWLEENGYGAVADELRRIDGTAGQARAAETKVMRKFVLDRMKAGDQLPLDLLGVSVQPIASVTRREPTETGVTVPRSGITG